MQQKEEREEQEEQEEQKEQKEQKVDQYLSEPTVRTGNARWLEMRVLAANINVSRTVSTPSNTSNCMTYPNIRRRCED